VKAAVARRLAELKAEDAAERQRIKDQAGKLLTVAAMAA
jgi:hypothetical protein